MNEVIIFIAIISSFFYSLTNVFTKIITSHFKNPFDSMFYQVTFYIIAFSIIYIIFLLLEGQLVTQNLFKIDFIIFIGLSGFFTFFGGIAFFYGISIGQASVSGIIQSSRILVSIIFAIIFFAEVYPTTIYVWIIGIFIGVLIVAYDDSISIKELILLKSKGLAWFLLAMFSWSFGDVFVRAIEGQLHVLSIMLIRILFIWIFIFLSRNKLTSIFNLEKTKIIKTKNDVIIFFLYTSLFIVADIFFIYALGQSLTLTETIFSFMGVFSFIVIIVLSKMDLFKKKIAENLNRQILLTKSIGMIIATFSILGLIAFS